MRKQATDNRQQATEREKGEENTPVRAVNAVRFGCGAILGAVVGLGVMVQVLDADTSLTAILAGCLVAAILFGMIASEAGDEFWYWIGKHWRWL